MKLPEKPFLSYIGTLLLLGSILTMFFYSFPYTNDAYDLPKRLIVIWITSFLLIIWGLRIIKNRHIEWTRTAWTIPIIGFMTSSAASIIIASPNKVAALLGNGGGYIALCVFFIVATSLIRKSITRIVLHAVAYSAVIVSILTILDQFGIKLSVLINYVLNLNLPTTTSYYTTGSALFTLSLLCIALSTIIVQFIMGSSKQKAFSAILGSILIMGIVVLVVRILPGKPEHPEFLSALNSWSVVTDVFKTPRALLIGVGTDTYSSAFSIFKPRVINDTPFWFVHFGNARDVFLELLVTHGILGTLAFTLILLTIFRLIKKAEKDDYPVLAGLATCLGLFVLFPPNIIVMTIFFALLIAWAIALKARRVQTKEVIVALVARSIENNQSTGTVKSLSILAILVSLITLVAGVTSLYFSTRAFAADIWFGAALRAAAKNNGQLTYTYTQEAIRLNPYNTQYRRSFAVTSLTVAQALSARSNQQKLNPQDQKTVITLIQQAIDQAKLATALDQVDSTNWDTLTAIYHSLIGSVDQADQWTIASLTQEIQLDPTNAQLRVTLGILYRNAKDSDQASQLFQQAIQLKPDYANAYYNLASIYQDKGDSATQLALLQKTLSLIPTTQQDHQTVQLQINNLSKQISEQKTMKLTPQPTPISSPEPVATSSAKTRIRLPTSSGVSSSSALPSINN